MHHVKAKLAKATMLLEATVATKHGPCFDQSRLSDNVKLNRHTAVDAAAIGNSAASKSIPCFVNALQRMSSKSCDQRD